MIVHSNDEAMQEKSNMTVLFEELCRYLDLIVLQITAKNSTYILVNYSRVRRIGFSRLPMNLFDQKLALNFLLTSSSRCKHGQ